MRGEGKGEVEGGVRMLLIRGSLIVSSVFFRGFARWGGQCNRTDGRGEEGVGRRTNEFMRDFLGEKAHLHHTSSVGTAINEA